MLGTVISTLFVCLLCRKQAKAKQAKQTAVVQKVPRAARLDLHQVTTTNSHKAEENQPQQGLCSPVMSAGVLDAKEATKSQSFEDTQEQVSMDKVDSAQ